jgi:5-amino-6-(5-phosphoribosylamino)uracil reductase
MAAVYAMRARFDAILVGAETVRRDNPSLSLSDRFPALAKERRGKGMPNDPAKVTVTRSGDLDPEAKFFTTGSGERYVLCPVEQAGTIKQKLGDRASVLPIPADAPLASSILQALSGQGIGGLFVEGGGEILSAFLSEGLGDKMRIAVAPVVTAGGARFDLAGATRRYKVEETERLGDTLVFYLDLKS